MKAKGSFTKTFGTKLKDKGPVPKSFVIQNAPKKASKKA